MECIDLNIENYEYDDILKLFNIPYNFGESDMKIAKKKVLMMHPDKSGLDKKYFLFFSAAYKLLFSVYEFREKTEISEKLKLQSGKIEYLAETDKYNKEILDSLKKNNKFLKNDFNKWFNKLFDEVKISNEYEENGHGDWLKNHDDRNEECNNLQDMHNKIENKKSYLRSNCLSKYSSINGFNDSNSYCDLTNSAPEEYGSDIFSKLQFEDLKKAHEESVVPVTEEDYIEKYKSLEDIRFQRGSQNLAPLSQEESLNQINNNKNREININSHRAFKLYKQQEEIDKANKLWWKHLKQLK